MGVVGRKWMLNRVVPPKSTHNYALCGIGCPTYPRLSLRVFENPYSLLGFCHVHLQLGVNQRSQVIILQFFDDLYSQTNTGIRVHAIHTYEDYHYFFEIWRTNTSHKKAFS